MVLLNIMPPLGFSPRSGGEEDTPATPLTLRALSSVMASMRSFFAPWSSLALGNSTTHESLTLPPHREHRPRRHALGFLNNEVRPLIMQGRLHDLAELLQIYAQPSDSPNEIEMQRESTSTRICSKISRRLLASMPEWLSGHHVHLTNRALEGAHSLAAHLTGDAAGASLAGGRTRFGAVASLIDAYMIDQFPSGIGLVLQAKRLNIPSVLATRHHTLGGGAVPAIAALMRRLGVANGEVSSHYPTIHCPNPSADIFWEASKNSSEIWRHSFNRLLDKGIRSDASLIMVVDDNLSDDVKNAIKEAFNDTIGQAYAGNDPRVTKQYKLGLCHSAALARSLLNSGKVAGLVSDLFSPRLQTEKSEVQFRKYFKAICSAIDIPPDTSVTELLDTLDAEKRHALNQVIREFNTLYRSLRRVRNAALPPTTESPSKETPQS